MAYIVDTATKNLGNASKGGTIDFNTANKQAQQRAIAAAAQKNNSSGSTSSGYNSGGGGGTTPVNTEAVNNSFDYAAFLEAQLAAQRAAAQEAYNRNMSRIASAYGSASGNLKSNYDSTVSRLNAARDKSMGDVRSDAEDSLRQAYINNMLSKKNLNQRLSAMGYNGGATESTMASLANNYGNSRTGINETLNKNIANLDQTYGDNLANALQSYNSAMSNLDLQRMQLEMQAENALQSMQSSSLSGVGSLLSMDNSYLQALAGALTNQQNYTYDASQATNDFVAGQAQQAASAEQSANYAKYLAQAQLQASNGANRSAIQNKLFDAVRNGDLDLNTAYAIINRYAA